MYNLKYFRLGVVGQCGRYPSQDHQDHHQITPPQNSKKPGSAKTSKLPSPVDTLFLTRELYEDFQGQDRKPPRCLEKRQRGMSKADLSPVT